MSDNGYCQTVSVATLITNDNKSTTNAIDECRISAGQALIFSNTI